MSDVEHFALIMLVVAVVVTAAVLSNTLADPERTPDLTRVFAAPTSS